MRGIEIEIFAWSRKKILVMPHNKVSRESRRKNSAPRTIRDEKHVFFSNSTKSVPPTGQSSQKHAKKMAFS